MRQFRTLFRVEEDHETGVLYIVGEKGTHDYPSLMVRLEGEFVPLSVSYGPIELALRLRYETLVRTLGRLQPIDGLQTTRQVGSTGAYLALGLRRDGMLLMRPTVVADAYGHITFNIGLPTEAREAFFKWLNVPQAAAGE